MASVIAEFICGCKHEVAIEEIGWWRTISTDSQGFVICVRHKVRRKNWNSLPEGRMKQTSNWNYAGVRPLDYERHLLFGEKLPVLTIELDSSGPDRRDNRDPEELGHAILAKSNGHSK